MKTKLVLLTTLLFSISIAHSQEISGTVYMTVNSEQVPLPGANVYYEDRSFGVSTDENGRFSIDPPKDRQTVIVSYIGYEPQRINADQSGIDLKIILKPIVVDEVIIQSTSDGRNNQEIGDIYKIGIEELGRAACCNLSESFETNASVDVSYSDGVSGAREIRLLGLDGRYTQILLENMPGIRGLSDAYGLGYVPGQWLDAILVSRGTGSVVNGYESLTGQINLEYKKPHKGDALFLNLFTSHMGKFEVNADAASSDIGNGASVRTLAHYENLTFPHDIDNDGFNDHPLMQQLNLMTRIKSKPRENFLSQTGIAYLYEDRVAGQHENFIGEGLNPYRVNVQTSKVDWFAKTGFIFNGAERSIGVTYRYYYTDMNAKFGNRYYDGGEHFANINAIHDVEISEATYLKSGLSYTFNDFEETFLGDNFNKRESVPGVFTELNYNPSDFLDLNIGGRVDHHNLFGWFYTPRLKLRLEPYRPLSFKLSAGKGYRAPNVFIENLSFLASNRAFEIGEDIEAERSWNFGANAAYEIIAGFNPISFNIDFYHTRFQNQIVADLENPRKVILDNLQGDAFSNSLQFDVTYDIGKLYEIKASYKRDDVFTTYQSGFQRVVLVPQNRALLNFAYSSENSKWKTNVTGNWTGKSRLPNTKENDPEFQLSDRSEDFFTMNAQINFIPDKNWNIYIGGENITSYRQKNAILQSDDPFGKFFDASLIWGPIDGARIYIGVKYKLSNFKKDKP